MGGLNTGYAGEASGSWHMPPADDSDDDDAPEVDTDQE